MNWFGSVVSPRGVSCLLLFVALVCSGCMEQPLIDDYGKRTFWTPQSVAGTTVLADMFEQAGHDVTTRQRLSPRLNKFQTLIWFPDSFAIPTAEERTFLENWLRAESGRTVIYVGRDYDAATQYWRAMANRITSGPDARVVDRRLRDAISRHNLLRGSAATITYATWFTARQDRPGYRVSELRGPWAEGIDGAATQIDLATFYDLPTQDARDGKLKPSKTAAKPNVVFNTPPQGTRKIVRRSIFGSSTSVSASTSIIDVFGVPKFDVLLASEKNDPVVTRLAGAPVFSGATAQEPESQLIVVTNGSFLVNLGLVNHEHRKLAAKVIEQCGKPGSVAFLESGPAGIDIRDTEPEDPPASGFELFRVFPLNAILLHMVAAGVLVCFVKLPIFGRAKKLPPEALSDFRKHIVAAGELLSSSEDADFAAKEIENYRQKVQAKNNSKTTRQEHS